MHFSPLDQRDLELVQAAKDIIRKRYQYERHHVGAALRTASGEIITSVHVEANIGRVTICAEAVAIGMAATEGKSDFETIVAVRHPAPDETSQEIRVVSPCGMCRELIGDYSPHALVILPTEKGLAKCEISELLPLKYSRLQP